MLLLSMMIRILVQTKVPNIRSTIDNINFQSLHRIQHNSFNTLHLSDYIYRIAFVSIHYIGIITLHSSVAINQIELSVFIAFVAFKASHCISDSR